MANDPAGEGGGVVVWWDRRHRPRRVGYVRVRLILIRRRGRRVRIRWTWTRTRSRCCRRRGRGWRITGEEGEASSAGEGIGRGASFGGSAEAVGIEAGGIVGIVGADDGPEDAKDYKHSPLTSRLLVKNSDPTILVQNVHTLV